jgi:cytochrome c oxidase cbb3-type subunit 3
MPKPQKDSTPILREHVYDGIQEYDQKLPNWWLFTLYITIAFFVFYWLAYYQLGAMQSDEERIHEAMARIDAARLKELESLDDPKLWKLSLEPATIEAGKATFQQNCAACHGPDLSGTLAGNKLPGLPLSDTEWKYGGNPTDVLKIVRKGSPDVTKGMPAWEPQLGVKRVVEVVAYIMSHHKEGEPTTKAADSPTP